MSIVAKTILSQLGGNKFIAMTGSKNFVGGPYSLTFKFPRSTYKSTKNMCKIVLNAMDLYDVTFYYVHGTNVKEVSKIEDVFNSDLRKLFETETGYYTSL